MVRADSSRVDWPSSTAIESELSMRMGQTLALESSGETHFPGLKKSKQIQANTRQRRVTNRTRIRLAACWLERQDRKRPNPRTRIRIGIRA